MQNTEPNNQAFISLREKFENILRTNQLTDETRAHFLGEVREAFNAGSISVNELDRLYSRASGDTVASVFSIRVSEDESAEKKEKLKQELSRLICTDGQLEKIVEAIIRWCRDIGVPDWEISEDRMGVAVRYVEQFFQCSNTIKTVGPFYRKEEELRVGLQKMRVCV